MRTIKFRAWNKKVGCWDLPRHEDHGDPVHLLVRTDIEDIIIEQFTGLLDKNGNEIYEGDVVKGLTWKEPYAQKNSREITGTVEWSDYNHGWVIASDLPDGFRTYLTFSRSEVIGNIHENPELLK